MKKPLTDNFITDACYIDFLKILKCIRYFKTLSTDAIDIIIADFEQSSDVHNKSYKQIFDMLEVCTNICIGDEYYDKYHRSIINKANECVRIHFESERTKLAV